MKLHWNLFLDDIRDPKTNKNWIVARSFEEAVSLIKINGFPSFISFDHDLGIDDYNNLRKSGYDFAKWIVENDLNNNFIREDFRFDVHSANPIGAKNIRDLLNSYLNQKFNKN